MDPSRLDELEELYEEALARPAQQRADFVREACSDEELCAELLSLLEVAPEASEYFDALTERLAVSVSHELEAAAGTPLQIGPYRIERQIGSGGMGHVYLGRLSPDSPPVAIKVLRPEILEEEVVRRFGVERSFLAGIDHPNIARLLDAGTGDGGTHEQGTAGRRPYFVMEYVDGLPIDRYCEVNRLGLAQRLRLFCELCAAVHFAHQNLVVHRDIKPGNVLVTAEGDLKLLDFGIAKFLDPSGMRWRGDETSAEVRLFTPDFASPEQVLGEPITTATDVFSLGAVLYLLLTGKRVHRFDSSSYPDMIRAITEDTPERPSTAVTRAVAAGEALPVVGGSWGRRLKGDLDAIVLKALRHEPEHRYASAVDLSEDIGRHLDGEPVSAHRGGLRYRSGKFVRRHRWPLAVVAAFVLSLVVFSWVTLQARQRAELEASRAQAINRFLTDDLLEAADPRRLLGSDVTMKEVLDAASERIEGRFEEDPLIESDIRRSLGATYHQLGDYDSAEPQLRRALELREQELGRLAEPTIAALSNLANLLSDRAEYDEALALQEEAVERARDGLPRDHSYRLSITNNLASLYSERGRIEEAEPLYREVLEERTRALGADDIGTIVTAVNLARLWGRTGREAESEDLLVDSLERSRRSLGEEHPHSFRIGTYLASLYNRQGRYEESEALHRRNLEGQLRSLGERHPDVLRTRNNLGAVLVRHGRHEEAYVHFQEVLAIRRETLGEEHPSTLMSMHNLAGGELERGNLAEAVALSREALGAAEKVFPEGHFNRVLFGSRLGVGLVALGELKAAEPLLVETYEPLADRLGPDHPGVSSVAGALVELYRARGDAAAADDWATRIENATFPDP